MGVINRLIRSAGLRAALRLVRKVRMRIRMPSRPPPRRRFRRRSCRATGTDRKHRRSETQSASTERCEEEQDSAARLSRAAGLGAVAPKVASTVPGAGRCM